MRLRHALYAVPLGVAFAAATPLAAQPATPPGGPRAADADGDARITRDEMAAYMDRRFSLMDQDGDGLVQVQTMQRLLGHEPQPRPASPDDKGRRKGKPGASQAAAPLPGRAMPWPEDGNDDGQIDRMEFLAPALALFADGDRSGDAVLSADELPPPGKD